MYNICMGIELKIIKKDLTILQTLLSHELGFNLRSWSSVAIFLMILQWVHLKEWNLIEESIG